MGAMDTLGKQHRQIYFVRRSFITLSEVRTCLAAITGTNEFKSRKPLLPDKHRDHIDEAQKFLNRNLNISEVQFNVK